MDCTEQHYSHSQLLFLLAFPGAHLPNDYRGQSAANEIKNKIPACVVIATYICFGNRQGSDKLNHLIEGAKPHATSGTQNA